MPDTEDVRPKVFISYSHKDEGLKDLFVSQLDALAQENRLEVWADTRIEAGDQWFDEIKKALESCCVALLLVSADFLSSKFIKGVEVPELLQQHAEKGVRLYPIICRGCDWESISWLQKTQAKPKDAKPLMGMPKPRREDAIADIVKDIRRIVGRTVVDPATSCCVLGPERISIEKLPNTGPNLFGRDNELAELDKAWNEQKTNVIGFRAWGGMGKSSLVNAWLAQRMQPQAWRGAELVLGWSFYSQGAAEGRQVSAEQFIDFALRWFGDPDPTLGSPWDRGRRLADLVKRQRTLLILDGLEPLQNPPGVEQFRIKDQGLLALLKSLAADNPGLCVVTTRFEAPDLDNWTATTVRIEELTRLPKAAGIELLKSLGVKGTPKEIEDAVEDVKGHALALTLLGNLLKDECGGDIRKCKELPPLAYDEDRGGHARRVIESYERIFDAKPELGILRIMGLFDRPAPLAAIAALRADSPIAGITDSLEGLSHREWERAVRRLCEAGLLANEDETEEDALDCHPLIREHFGEKVRAENPNGWKEAHRRLYEYYKSVPEKELPDTLEEMAPLLAAVAHGCQAGLHKAAFDDVYLARIRRQNDAYLPKRLGGFGADLAAISSFYEEQWSDPVADLGEPLRSWLLNATGYCLRALGRLNEAVPPIEAAFSSRFRARDWRRASRYAGNLSELHLMLGHIKTAGTCARRCVRFADRDSDPTRMMTSRTTLADVLHHAGRMDEANKQFADAERLQRQLWPNQPLLYSLWGFRYCDLLLANGEYAEALRRATVTIRIAERNNWLLHIALDHLSVGRAHLLGAECEGKGNLSQAERQLNEAVDGVRAAGTAHYLPVGLLARAHLYRFKRDFPTAKLDIDEAIEIAERGEMGLYLADCHLEYARLYLAWDKKTEARKHLDIVRPMIEKMGYHRRDKEVAELEEKLA